MKFVFALVAALCLSGVAQAKSVGLASYYACCKRTANGERFNKHGFTAAHRRLPFGTWLRVTNLRNGKSVNVRVNDRGPFIKKRVIDLSLGAARAIGLTQTGVSRVSFVVIKQPRKKK